jgi:TatD DNase family protein
MFIDIAANLTDDMFEGIYHDKKRHESDLGLVIERAKDAGCNQMIVLAGTLNDAKNCLAICERFDPSCVMLYTTVGYHPTRCGEALALVGENADGLEAEEKLFDAFSSFINQAGSQRVVAIGEFGLDYDRLHFCSKEVQKRFFEIQLRVAARFPDLPLLLHLRNAFDDFIDIIQKYKVRGVVHSFTGSREEMQKLVDIGLSIGINGCSLRDALDVVPFIPEQSIMIETDSPYCDIRATHLSSAYLKGLEIPTTVKPEKFVQGSLVKGRNEPACINQVAFVLAGVRKTDFVSLSGLIRQNTLRLFTKLAR